MSRSKMVGKTILSMVMVIIIPIFWMLFRADFFSPAPVQIQKFTPSPWPPALNQPYPDLELIDQEGLPFRLSALKGKVIIIEPTGMNCPACQAFSGAHERGSYENNPVEQHSQSYRKIFPKYAKSLKFPSKDIVFIQILLYDMKMRPPQPEDAKKWAEHFNIRKDQNHIVAVSPYDLRSSITYNMIPGFQLIGKDFILRADSTGHHPRHNLYTQLIPHTVKLVNQQ